VPLDNESTTALPATIEAAFEGVVVGKSLTLAPGRSQVAFDANEFPQLKLKEPRLWWPNGYGPANLYPLKITVHEGEGVSDTQLTRFGIRQLTYELSLFDHSGRLRRVEIDPSTGSLHGERLVDVRHETIKQVPNGWAEFAGGRDFRGRARCGHRVPHSLSGHPGQRRAHRGPRRQLGHG
jgi:hypothetical protein